MNNRRIKSFVLLSFVLFLIVSMFCSIKSNSNKPVENTKEENKIKRKQFSMYVENDKGEYDEYNFSNMFPTGYILDLDKSKCLDNNGIEVAGVLSGNNNHVTVTSNKTVFCYVYFNKAKILSDYLVDTVASDVLWKSTLENDGYRYVGTNPDNYICFGTTDKNLCLNNPDKYMYRIIGIFDDENGNKYVKLIKRKKLTGSVWNSNNTINVDWDNSDLYKGLNGSYFLTNTEYSYMQDDIWSNMISYWDYTMTNTKTYENYSTNGKYGIYYNDNMMKTIYLHELNRSNKSNSTCYYEYGTNSTTANCNAGEWKTANAKIGLMYVSDYALSLGEKALNYFGKNDYGTLKTSWMHLNNSGDTITDTYEWTMSRIGLNNGKYEAYRIAGLGGIYYDTVDTKIWVCPVFYLNSDVKYSGGSGTADDPMMLT